MIPKTALGLSTASVRVAPPPQAHVLVVEDHPFSQMLTGHLLENLEIKATFVSSGEAAIEAVAKEPFSLILMDLRLPGIDGIECTRRLRESANRPDLIIIAVTGKARPQDQQACLDAGMNDYLSKPITVDSFTAMMVRWLTPEP